MLTTDQRLTYLRTLNRTFSENSALAAANIDPEFVAEEMREDVTFRQQVMRLRRALKGKLEERALDLAINGMEVPVYHRGRRIDQGQKREYSVPLLIYMLRAHIGGQYELAAGDVKDPQVLAEALRQFSTHRLRVNPFVGGN